MQVFEQLVGSACGIDVLPVDGPTRHPGAIAETTPFAGQR